MNIIFLIASLSLIISGGFLIFVTLQYECIEPYELTYKIVLLLASILYIITGMNIFITKL